MNLKEAFQAQNKIDSLLEYIVEYLSDEENVMLVTDKHLRSKTLPGQPDETADVSVKRDEDFAVDGLLEIWQKLLAEKEKLGAAIGRAKAGMEFNLDAAIDMNKRRRSFDMTLQEMAGRKSYHMLQKGGGKGYVFNKDGTPTEYYYDIDRVWTIDYDRTKVRALAKEMHRTADAMSIRIDEALLSTKVDYVPQFDLAGKESLLIEEMLGR